jgi:hypothetical protein
VDSLTFLNDPYAPALSINSILKINKKSSKKSSAPVDAAKLLVLSDFNFFFLNFLAAI